MNNTFPLGYVSGSKVAEIESTLIYMEMDSVIMPEDEDHMQYGLGWINAVAFGFFRSKLYKRLYQQYKMKELTVINILTLIVCLVQHLEIFWGLMYEVMLIWVQNGYIDDIMPWFCKISTHVLFFFWGYSALGGLGIAIYRIMLIKHHYVVNDVIGKKCFMFIIIFLEILILSFTLILLTLSNSLWYPLRPPCFYLAEIGSLEIIDAYNQSFESSVALDLYMIDKICRAALFLSFMFTEIIIYIMFFHSMHKHNKNENLKKLLTNEVIHQRNKNNVLSFLSLFFSFLVEALFFILIVISQVSPFHHKGPLALRKLSLTAMAFVEVITSKRLNHKSY